MSENDKLCPLLTRDDLVGCYGNKCGMWNEYLGCCGLIAQGLASSYDVPPRVAADIAERKRYAPWEGAKGV